MLLDNSGQQGGQQRLAAGTEVTHNPDGSVSVGGQVLPPGATVETLPDGSVCVKGSVLDIPKPELIYHSQTQTNTINTSL